MRSRSAYSPARSSRTGFSRWHGPHHSAQKSTRTGTSLASTSSAKVASVTSASMSSPFPLTLLGQVHARRGYSGLVGSVAETDQVEVLVVGWLDARVRAVV